MTTAQNVPAVRHVLMNVLRISEPSLSSPSYGEGCSVNAQII
jgi:hypothetical protein